MWNYLFPSRPDYSKLKSNLRLSITRLKLLEKKKTEIAQKFQKEISQHIMASKFEKARICVEQLIHQDNLIEGMELVEMFCDLLLARFGLMECQSTIDPGLEEAIATILWVFPRLQGEIAEFRPVADNLTIKYSKEFAQACQANTLGNVNEKVMQKLDVRVPPQDLIEKYMITIAQSYNVPYTPDRSKLLPDNKDDDIGIPPPPPDWPGDFGGGGGEGGREEKRAEFWSLPYSAEEKKQPLGPGVEPEGAGGFTLLYPHGNEEYQQPDIPRVGPPPPYDPRITSDYYQSPAEPPRNNHQPYHQLPPDNQSPVLPHRNQPSPPGNCQQPVLPALPPNHRPEPPAVPPVNSHHTPSVNTTNMTDDTSVLDLPDLPELPPNVLGLPGQSKADSDSESNDDLNFDDLSRRFEDLKKRK